VRHFLANTGEILEDVQRPFESVLDVQLDIFPADVLNKFSLLEKHRRLTTRAQRTRVRPAF